LNSNSK